MSFTLAVHPFQNPHLSFSIHLHYRDADGTHSGNEERQTCRFYNEHKVQMKPLGRACLRFFEVLHSLSAVMCIFWLWHFLSMNFGSYVFFYLHFHTDKPSVSWEAGCVCVRKKGKNIININVTKYPHAGPHTKINIHTARFTSVPHLNLFQ